MIQTSFFSQSITACVFTGHRALDKDFSQQDLLEAIRELLRLGVCTFYCGMAMGFDLLAAQILLSFKKEFSNFRLVACIPCPNQEKYYTEEQKKLYSSILEQADERILLSENYYQGCMLARDRYMVEKSDCLIGYCKKKTGGTAYTLRYFQSKHPNGKTILL